MAVSDESTFLFAPLGYTYAIAGNRDEARKVLERLKELSQRRYAAPYFVALIHVGLGELDQAFACLEKAYEERSSWLAYLKVEPMAGPLRPDPRSQDPLRRVGLAP